MCSTSSDEIYDLIGLGFGPANLAIASALSDKWASAPISISASNEVLRTKVLFLEKFESFKWHPGMLLPDARMQISFLKDLATLRSPQSPLTFLAYLHSQNRLVPFINRGSNIPTRKEYADYLSWAAQTVQDNGVQVKFGSEVIGLEENPSGTISVRSRDVSSGLETVREAKNIVLSPGGSPFFPPLGSSTLKHPFVIHTSRYAMCIPTIVDTLKAQSNRPLRVAVIGSGQSACEVTLNLRERLASAAPNGNQIDMIVRKGALKPSDDSPFSNEIFDPSATDDWFSLSSQRLRESRLHEYKSTNYGVANPRTLDQLYEVIYDQMVDESIAKRTSTPNQRTHALIRIRPYTSLLSAETAIERTDVEASSIGNRTFDVVLQNTATREIIEDQYDAIILATGYQRLSWIRLLRNSNMGKRFGVDADSTNITLTPAPEAPFAESSQDQFDRAFAASKSNHEVPSDASSSPLTDSTTSTPPVSEFSSTILDPNSGATRVYISRRYRLLPVPMGTDEARMKAKVYLQGVEESTHGLSDTLLSVLGVRAGEVVEDLYKA